MAIQTKRWSRKGRCPECKVSTGSRHKVLCSQNGHDFMKMAFYKKLSLNQQRIYRALYEEFLNQNAYPEGVNKDQVQVVAHNLSALAVWRLQHIFMELLTRKNWND